MRERPALTLPLLSESFMDAESLQARPPAAKMDSVPEHDPVNRLVSVNSHPERRFAEDSRSI